MSDMITIRPVKPGEFEALTDLKLEMNRAEHALLPETSPIRSMLDLSREAAATGVQHYFEAVGQLGGAIFVAEKDGQVVGSILWHVVQASAAFTEQASRMAMICGVVVAPQARGLGLGRLLMRHVEASIRDAGIGYAMLEVTADNVPAQGLYLAEGYSRLELAMVKAL
jgi:ribosomal protein S18 acetylase RimI-like enzyme